MATSSTQRATIDTFMKMATQMMTHVDDIDTAVHVVCCKSTYGYNS